MAALPGERESAPAAGGNNEPPNPRISTHPRQARRAPCAPFRRAALADRQRDPRNGSIGTSRARFYIHLPCGIEANADFATIRERVKKMADIGPAFAAPWQSAAKPRPMSRRLPTQGHRAR